MTTAERRSIILRLLDENDQVNVVELSKEFGVSEVTIRNDLGSLEEKNLLVRARGGAIKASVMSGDVKLSEKNKKNLKEKKAIGKAASKLISDGDTVLVDSGSTTEELSRHLSSFGSLTVVTNALNIVSQFSDNANISVIVPGGVLRHNSFSLVGVTSEQRIREYFCDKLILGVDGIDVNHGIFTPHLEEANLNKAMIDISNEVIVVTDSSKFGKRSLSKIGDITLIDTLVTDTGLDAESRAKLEEAGVKLILVDA